MEDSAPHVITRPSVPKTLASGSFLVQGLGVLGFFDVSGFRKFTGPGNRRWGFGLKGLKGPGNKPLGFGLGL